MTLKIQISSEINMHLTTHLPKAITIVAESPRTRKALIHLRKDIVESIEKTGQLIFYICKKCGEVVGIGTSEKTILTCPCCGGPIKERILYLVVEDKNIVVQKIDTIREMVYHTYRKIAAALDKLEQPPEELDEAITLLKDIDKALTDLYNKLLRKRKITGKREERRV